ncbi:MAG TPA: TolC family protein [Gemmatimonadaceae bacterium]
MQQLDIRAARRPAPRTNPTMSAAERRRPRSVAALAVLGALALAGTPLAAQTGAGAPERSAHLALHDVLAAARAHGPAVDAARASVDESRRRIRESQAALLPQLGASGYSLDRDYNRQSLGMPRQPLPGGGTASDLVGPFANQDLRATARLSLVDLAAHRRVGLARDASAVAERDQRAAADGAEAAAARAYVELQRAQSLVAVRAADTALAVRLVDIATSRHAAGATSGIDVTRAQVQLAAARTAYALALGGADRARYELLRAMGAPVDESSIAVDSLALLPLGLPENADTLVALALAARPEIRAQEARVALATHTRAAIRAEALPVLSLAGDYGVNGNVSNGRTEGTGSVGVFLSWSGWDGGRRHARVGEQDAAIVAAEARLRDLRAAVTAETRGAITAWRSARSAVGTARERTTLAARELEQAEQRYGAGLSGSLDVISAQEGLIRAEDASLAALAEYDLARLGVWRALGRLDAQ